MYNTSSSGFGKISKSKGKTNPSGYYGRGEMIDPDLYYTVYDENTSLKKKLHQLEIDNKKLSSKLQYNKIPNPIKEESKSEIKTDKNTLKIENENLRTKNKRLNEKLKTLEKYIKDKKPRPYMYSHNTQISGKRYPNVYQVNDYEKLITHLQQTLKTAHEDRRKLIDDLNNLKEAGTSKAIIEYSENIRDKNLKLSEMSLQLDRLKEAFETNEKILQITKKTLDEYTEKYTIERNKNRELENQIQKQKSSLEKLDEYANKVEEYKKKEQIMEQKIMDLCENPFIKQINERDNTFANLRETQIALSEAQRRLKIDNDKIIELEKQLRELNEKYNKILQERDKFREDGMRYKIDKEEREKQGREFDAIFNKINQFGEVDSNYEKIINLLKGQLTKDAKGNNWENMDFLEKMDEFPDNKEEIIKEIQRLKIEKGILGQELEKTKNLLSIQQQLNEDIKKKQEVETKLYIKQINSLKDKLRRLAELVDRRNLPADFDLNTIYRKDNISTKIIDNKDNDEYNININNKSIYTSITGFSKDSEEDFAIDENCLDLYITSANFDIECVQNKLGLQIDNLKSFISVDFYLHETQTSNLMTGQKPNYNFQLSFKVTVDENFIIYLQDDFIIIELYYLKNNTQTIFANGKIPLNQLIQIENDPKTRVIHGYIEMFCIDDSSIKICDIKYKMRMRNSILEKINWINEKNKLFKELDPINEANMKIMGELNLKQPLNNILTYYDKDNINNKVYNITIMIGKAEGLKVVGPSRRILPYIYYRFYKQNEHFSNTMAGSDPLFDDMQVYTCVYNGNFHEYLDKETLNIYIFDASKPIQVDTDGKEVEMVRNYNNTDLIGICKIKLRGLILNNRIEEKFAVLNEEGTTNVGYLTVNIVAEEIMLDSNDKNLKNNFDPKIIEGVDPLVVKLAAILREKGLNMNSAFRIFDKDNEDQISLDNFKSVVLFTLGFTKKDDELTKLADIIFKNKVILDKQDFYQIFNNLLPFDDDFNNNNNTKPRVLGENTEISFTVIDKQNTKTFLKDKNYNTTGVLKQNYQNNNTQNNNITYYNNNNVFNNSNTNNFNNNQNVNNISSPGRRRSRTINEIMIKVDDFMIYFGKRTASDLFKIFDQDANLRVGIKELAEGFAKMQIYLNPEELAMIWKHIVISNTKDSFGIDEFMEFYEKNKIQNRKAK